MPMSDIVFAIVISRVLFKLKNALKDQGLENHVESRGKRFTFEEVAFHDDVGIPIVSEACDLVQKVTCYASTAVTVFAVYGMALNFSGVKTEAIIKFMGNGCYNCKEKIRK